MSSTVQIKGKKEKSVSDVKAQQQLEDAKTSESLLDMDVPRVAEADTVSLQTASSAKQANTLVQAAEDVSQKVVQDEQLVKKKNVRKATQQRKQGLTGEATVFQQMQQMLDNKLDAFTKALQDLAVPKPLESVATDRQVPQKQVQTREVRLPADEQTPVQVQTNTKSAEIVLFSDDEEEESTTSMKPQRKVARFQDRRYDAELEEMKAFYRSLVRKNPEIPQTDFEPVIPPPVKKTRNNFYRPESNDKMFYF